MKILHEHIVPQGTDRQRLSDYAPLVFDAFASSKKGMKKLIKRGAFTIDGQPAQTGTWVLAGQCIRLLDISPAPTKVYELELEVVFEDDHLALINKPGGIPVSGNQFRSIQNSLTHNLKPSSQPDALAIPRPVHRLDAPTCGLLLVAKTSRAIIGLSRQFEEKTIQKRYQAIAMGKVEQAGYFDQRIDGKEAYTQFQCLEQVRSIKSKWLSLLNLFPQTGRTHQLRIHLSQAGHPILGDAQYGIEGLVKKGKGLFLCAAELSFEHPISGKTLSVCIDPPAKFAKTMEREERMWHQLNRS
jgi:23S rRNA pseudouridine1911/1915/1917 synthase